jgi:hypothetical protein
LQGTNKSLTKAGADIQVLRLSDRKAQAFLHTEFNELEEVNPR